MNRSTATRPDTQPAARPWGWAFGLLTLLTLVGLVGAPWAWAQFGRTGRIKNFKLPDFYPPGIAVKTPSRLRSLITGAEAQPLPNGLIAVHRMRIENYLRDGRTNLVAQAPACRIDPSARTVTSAGRLDLRVLDGRIVLTGEHGFTFYMTNTHLIVSNRVRTVIQRQLLETAQP